MQDNYIKVKRYGNKGDTRRRAQNVKQGRLDIVTPLKKFQNSTLFLAISTGNAYI